MTSHELARLLLALPDLPVATHANNHTFEPSPLEAPRVGLMEARKASGAVPEFILIGNFSRKRINHPNEYVRTVYAGGDVPENWR